MKPDPLDSYKLVKARQQQFWNDAERDRWAQGAIAQWTSRLLFGVGALLGSLVGRTKARRKTLPVLANRHMLSSPKTPAQSCQRSAANVIPHPRLSPNDASRPCPGTHAGLG